MPTRQRLFFSIFIDSPVCHIRSMRPLKFSPSPPSEVIVKRKACTGCRTRKVKCDRATPCSTCTSWNIACSYPSPQRTCRRTTKNTTNSTVQKNQGFSQQFLEDTFQKLVAEVIDVNGPGNPDEHELGQLDIPAQSREALHELQAVKGSLERTLSLVAAWTAKHPALATAALSSRHSHKAADLRVSAFPFDTWAVDTTSLHPSSAAMRVYHKLFFNKIDPLVKVLHRATTESLLNKAMRDPSSLRAGELSIVFSVYLAALCSMPEIDANALCGMPKPTALATYKGAVEQALARAKLGATDDLTTVQGFVLYLGVNRFCASDSNQTWANRAWALTGLASRVASTPSSDAKSPFEHEMRRRLHLALWYLEHRAREDLGHGVSELWDMTDELAIFSYASQPTNALDKDLDPRMSQPPMPCSGWTEISFSLMQVEIAAAARTVRAASTLVQKDAIIDACERRVSEEYLRYCDGSSAVHWLAKHVSYVLIMELRFQTYGHLPAMPLGDTMSWSYCRQPLIPPNDQLLLDAVDMLDTERRVRGEPQAAQWSWLLAEFLQFWPLLFLLGRLCSQPLLQDVGLGDRAWHVAELSFRQWERPENKSAGSSYVEVLRKLWSQAQASRMRVVSLAGHFGVLDVPLGDDFPMFSAALFAGGTPQNGILQAEDMGFWAGLMSSDVPQTGNM